MSTTPEAIERKIVAKEAEVELVKRQLQDASGDRELLLLQQLTALRQELAALQQVVEQFPLGRFTWKKRHQEFGEHCTLDVAST